MDIELEFCPLKDGRLVMEFIDAYYQAGHILATNQGLFDWQYRNEADARYNFLLAREKTTGDILGILGFICNDQYDPGLRDKNTLWLALWQVVPKTGIPSLGLQLFKALPKMISHQVFAVSGINPSLFALLQSHGILSSDLQPPLHAQSGY